MSSKHPGNFGPRALALGTSTLYEASGLPCAIDPVIRAGWSSDDGHGVDDRAIAVFDDRCRTP